MISRFRSRSLGLVLWLALVAGLALLTAAPSFAADGKEHGEDARAQEEHEQGDDVPFNWAYGFVGEKDGVEPSLLYRPKGMAPPFLANIINAALLFVILGVMSKKPIAEGLKKRKERLVGAMQEAAKMKADSEVSLTEYETKLAHVDQEIARIRHEMRESAEAERRRILSEAKERRERMERDAKLLVEQELKAARETLMRETVAGALRSAEEILAKQLGAADQDRIARDFLETVKTSAIASVGSRS